MLIKFCHNNKSTWDEYLDSCIFAYNTSKYLRVNSKLFAIDCFLSMQGYSLYSPFEVMFGCKPVLPIDINEQIYQIYRSSVTWKKLLVKLMERLGVFKEVKENIGKAQSKQKRIYSQKHAIPIAFEVSNLCMQTVDCLYYY